MSHGGDYKIVLKASRAGLSGPQRWTVNSAREKKVRERHPTGNTEPIPLEDTRQDLTGNKRGLRLTEHKAKPTNGKGSQLSTEAGSWRPTGQCHWVLQGRESIYQPQ